MTPDALAKLHQHRKVLAATIETDASNFKVCDSCGSVAAKVVPVCPFCKAYRFNEANADVIETARKIGETPWPQESGTAPRL